MLEQLEAILTDLDGDRSVRVVVVTGAGDRSFCAGADIKRFKALQPLDMWAQWTRRGLRVFDHLAKLRQPTIAAVSGNAYGGGFELALACDLRVLADDATLGLTEVGIGALPGWGGTGRLRDLVGAGRAKQLIFTGQPATAEQALAWGIVNQVTAKSEVLLRRQGTGKPDRQQGSHQCSDGQAGHRLRQCLRADGTGGLSGHRFHRRRPGRTGLLHREAPAQLQRPLIRSPLPPSSCIYTNRGNHP